MKKEISLAEIGIIIEEFMSENRGLSGNVDIVIGVSRGGLILAGLLAAKIDKPLIAVYIDKKDEIFFDRGEWINGKNVLVVDDVVRSGKTLRLVKNYLDKKVNPKNILFFAPYKVRSLGKEEYAIKSFSREIEEDVNFPWD